MRSIAALTLLAVLALLPAAAGARTSFSGTYQAHNAWAWFDSCTIPAAVNGAEPAADGPAPVFIWVGGTGAEGTLGYDGTLSPQHDMALAKAAIQAAADAGWVAAYPHYRGGDTVGYAPGEDAQAACMFNRARSSTSLLDVVCARPKADCSRVVVAGHSQGGVIAMRAANHWAGVKAAWATAVFAANASPAWYASRERGGGRVLPDSAVRIATGQSDMYWQGGNYAGLRTYTGLGCPDGVKKADGTYTTVDCMRPDGSGWIIVKHAAPPDGPSDKHADHCFMSVNGTGCKEPQPVDPYWLTGSASWTLRSALGWLKGRAG